MAPSPPPDTPARQVNGGRFDFDDGGTYCGGWEDGKAHGHGVCTGPKAQGEYAGSWHYGFEVSGVYTWPSGSTYEGHWQNGRRHGLGVEARGRWVYRGEWTQGFKGRYGVRQSTASSAKYEGTWANGLQDGYGSETYADSGTYQGQWQRGSRHGYGVRTSAAFGTASISGGRARRHSASSLRSDPAADRDRRVNDTRGGFVLKADSDEPPLRAASETTTRPAALRRTILQGLRLRKQRSTGDLERRRAKDGSVRSTGSSVSWLSSDSAGSHPANPSRTESNASFVVEDEQMDSNVTETYMGEWKNDRRVGYGVCERSDGLKYEGEWYNNKKYGYGITTFRDGTREEGKYKNNVLVSSTKKKHLFLVRSARFRERIEAAVSAASRGSKIALQKADIAISRTATARGKAEQADVAAQHAREDAAQARLHAKQFAPDFLQPGSEGYKSRPEVSGGAAVDSSVPQYRLAESPPRDGRPEPPPPPPPPLPPNGVPPGLAAPQLGSALAAPMGGRRLSAAVPHHAPPEPAEHTDTASVDYFPAALTRRTAVPAPESQLAIDPAELSQAARRSSRQSARGGPGPLSNVSNVSNDRLDQYRRAPSRERSVRRTPLPPDAPQPWRPDADRTPDSGVSETMDEGGFFIPETPEQAARLLGGGGVAGNMKRTESLFLPGPQGRRGGTPSLTATTLQRKKSMPDAAVLPVKSHVMPREEANQLAAEQREARRHEAALAAAYRANPLLYVYNPDIKDWFSRQRLVLAVMLLNISLAVMFVKLLT